MKKMRLAAAALVLGSCLTLGAVPANANPTEPPVASQVPSPSIKGNSTDSGFGCIISMFFGIRQFCTFRR